MEELGPLIIGLQERDGIICAVKGKEVAAAALLLDHRGVASHMGKENPHDL